MDKHEQAIQRGEEASRLMNSTMFNQAFADTRQGIFEAMASLDSSDDKSLADLHKMVKLLDRVKKCIQTHIETGQITQKALQAKKPLFSIR
jgi:hypothetical protein